MNFKKFNPGKKITAFFIFFATTFFLLGLWQVERGHEKSNIIEQFNNNSIKNPKLFSKVSSKWDRVKVKGIWNGSKQILIDNVINSGIAGYKVLTPLQIDETGIFILVDRGWISQGKSRDTLPKIDIKDEYVEVTGILEDPELGFVLSKDLVTDNWPKVSQTKNLDVLRKEFEEQLSRYILVADPTLKSSLAYIKIIPSNMTAEKHFGYAIQWFTMFVALCLMYIWIGFKKNEE
jgi:surfeit locus 1 family protein